MYECACCGICDVDSVVEPTLPESVWLCDPPSPTVPETSGHTPQPLVYRGSDADRIMTGIVRRQAAGGLGADPGQAMRVRLRATRGIALTGCSPDIFTRSSIIGSLSRKHCIAMTVAGELCLRQRGLADSAGNTRPQPSTPCLPGLRRGSHNVRHSMAKDG